MTKWLYFRSKVSVGDDDGFISAPANFNSELRSSALLKYENLEAILPFTTDQDEFPIGGSAGNYTGIIMIFKSCINTSTALNATTTQFLTKDRIFLEVNDVDSISTCKNIINFIEKSPGNFIKLADANSQGKDNAPSVLECKHIEIARTWKTLAISGTHNANT